MPWNPERAKAAVTLGIAVAVVVVGLIRDEAGTVAAGIGTLAVPEVLRVRVRTRSGGTVEVDRG